MALVAQKGELKDVFGWFEDEVTGAVIIPGTVVLHQKTPGAVLSTPAFLTEVAPTAISTAAGLRNQHTGVPLVGTYYRYRVDLNEVGTWKFKWKPTGTGQAATPDIDIVVEPTVFP